MSVLQNKHFENSHSEIAVENEVSSNPDKLGRSGKSISSNRRKILISFLGLIFFFLTSLLLVIYFFYQSSDNRSSANQIVWLYNNHSCRLPININNSTTDTINAYPVKVKVDYNFFNSLPPRCKPRSDFGDIRFSDLNGKELPFAVENNSTQNKFISFHVKLEKLVAGENKILMYVGNPNELTTANPKATYDYYQDFNNFNPTVKFGVFTDLHHDGTENHFWNAPDGKKAALRDARPRLRHIISEMNNWEADFLVSLGDLITGENFKSQNYPPYPNEPAEMLGELSSEESKNVGKDLRSKSRKDLEDIEFVMKSFTGERYYIHSNHEFYFLSNEEVLTDDNAILAGQGVTGNEKATSLTQRQSHFYADKGGVRFIGLDLQYDANPTTDGRYRHKGPEGASNYGEGFMPPWQLDWLDKTLASTQNPVVIFSPSHLENSDYLEDELPEESKACENSWSQNYCTDAKCRDNPQSCIQLCKELGEYRRVKNASAIRSILEKHAEKILLVLQGNDHARAHYVVNGINYLTLDGAESIKPEEVSYYKFEIDPIERLVAIQSFGRDNTYSINYSNGQMKISSSLSKEFLVAPIFLNQNKIEGSSNTSLMVNGKWFIDPKTPSQQIGMGFVNNADKLKIHHRCANDGRLKRNNLIGIRRVFANKEPNNYIGTELVSDGISRTSLDETTNAKTGVFWAQLYNGEFRSWYSDGVTGKALPLMQSSLSKMSPGLWVFDNTEASVDYFIVRKAVFPEPKSTVMPKAQMNPR